jgi:hypothetical protein
MLGAAALEAIRAAIELPFDAGLVRERTLAHELLQMPHARKSLATAAR